MSIQIRADLLFGRTSDRCRCSGVRVQPECSALEGRHLLSTAAGGLPATTLIPPAAEIANAEAVLTSNAPQEFVKYTKALTALERTSSVTPAQFDALVQDKAAIDAAIVAADLSASSTQDKINTTADVIDASFTDTNEAYQRSQLESHLTGASVSPEILKQTFAAMSRVGREVMGRASSAAKLAKENTQTIISLDLGPNPDTNIWPGAPRDPLVVYYNGQIENFVRIR
jgi:hypothetical protein